MTLGEITESQMRGYVAGFKARLARESEQRRVLERQARQAVAGWLARLRTVPETTRVILYGSLAKGAFRDGSDIDIAVEELPSTRHFRLWAELEREYTLRLDLQRWEEFTEGFRRVIESYGEVLYAKPRGDPSSSGSPTICWKESRTGQ